MTTHRSFSSLVQAFFTERLLRHPQPRAAALNKALPTSPAPRLACIQSVNRDAGGLLASARLRRRDPQQGRRKGRAAAAPRRAMMFWSGPRRGASCPARGRDRAGQCALLAGALLLSIRPSALEHVWPSCNGRRNSSGQESSSPLRRMAGTPCRLGPRQAWEGYSKPYCDRGRQGLGDAPQGLDC